MHETLLKNIASFIELTDEEKEYFLSILRPKKLRKRQYHVQAGDMCRYETYVVKGCLRQYYVDDEGIEHTVSFAIEDWWTSDMYGLITGNPSLTNIEAIEDSELLLIEKNDFDKLVLAVPKFERLFRIKLQRAFVAHQRRIVENMSMPADQRYLNFTEQYPSLEQRLPLKLIASYLGITPESLSRIRRQLVKGK
ncbi:MAG: Crp/Fnr family transcriptional regulator [Sphingobacteriales bacterium]|nr:Crp/Fnr family transcriptional regulator [Sphingobacteriales bacterium]